MGESLWLHERCLALQLVRDEPPPCRPSKPPRPPPSQLPPQKKKGGPPNTNISIPKSEALSINPISPNSQSTGSDTPTPTNGVLPVVPTSPTSNVPTPSNVSHLNKYQDGYLLFQAWQAANTVCVWNADLMSAVQEAIYVGLLVGGILLVGGSSKALATLTHAWARSLLVAPIGFTLVMLGEVSGCKMVAVPQGHFTPLADALCWVIHRLTESGGSADPESLFSTLRATFPSLNAPDSTIIHATLSTLIHQRKVYHSGKSYGIVHPDTYQLKSVIGSASNLIQHEINNVNSFQVTPQQLVDSNHQRAPEGGAQLIVKDGLCHAMAQTNLAELITGVVLPSDKIIKPNPQGQSKIGHPFLERQGSLGMLSGRRNHHARSASLRLSPNKVAQLSQVYGDKSVTNTVCNSNVYEANDMSDITIKAERGSVLTKLLRVSPRRRLASFSAQFPPPEWTDDKASVTHFHSVAVQTSSRQRKDSTDILWSAVPTWAPRSSTLPRRLRRPLSCTPPLSQSSNSETPPPMLNTSNHILGPETSHSDPYANRHSSLHSSPVHRSHMVCKGSLDRLQSDPSHYYYVSENRLAHDNYRYISQSDQYFEGQNYSSDNLDITHTSPGRHKINVKRQTIDGAYRHVSPEHHAFGSKSHGRTSKKSQALYGKRYDEGVPKRREAHQKRQEDVKGKETTCIHKQKSQYIENKQQKSLEDNCKHKSIEKDKKKDNAREPTEGLVVDYDETPVRDQPNPPKVESNSNDLEINISIESDKEKTQRSPRVKKKEVCDSLVEVQRRKNTKTSPTHQEDNTKRYNRSSLQLDLTVLHMNNSKKVVSSPHRPEGLTNNMLHDNKEMNDMKESSHDVTNRNLGYREVDKCHKQPCTQTLGEAHQGTDSKVSETDETPKPIQTLQEGSSKGKTKVHRSPKRKLVGSLPKDPNIMTEDKSKTTTKLTDEKSPDDSNVTGKKVSPDVEVASIDTYPSLSELNLNFSSLAAQKILHGVSHNSIDTLVEVNLAAEKRKVSVKRPDRVTNTDFGFL